MNENLNDDKNIEELHNEYEKHCKELIDLINKDYPIPVLKERYFFIENKTKRIFNEILEMKQDIETNQISEMKSI